MGMKLKTRDRILRGALELFNTEGEAQISTVDIASVLDMSPGNLYYHFKGKEVIIEALFEAFETEITQVLNAPITKPLAVDDNWVFIYIIFEEIYDFRFFYNNISAILERCETLRPRFSRILSLKYNTALTLLATMEEQGLFVFDSDEKEALAERLTAHLTFWLQFYNLRNHNYSQQKIIHYGVYETLIQLTPYLADKNSPFPDLLQEFFTQQMA